MPDLTGLTAGQAEDKLAGLGGSGKIHVEETPGERCSDSSQAQGKICGQNPPAGEEHLAILDVFLYVQGKREAPKLSALTIPDGTSADKAREMILKHGFTGAVEVLQSSEPGAECQYVDRDPGNVCAQSPDGSRGRVPADATWTLVVQAERTKWDPNGYIPDIIGMTVTDALDKLREENFSRFSVGFFESGDCEPMVVCDVANASSTGGQRFDVIVSRNAGIRLIVGSRFPDSAPEGAVWPDVTGDALELALVKIDATGLNSPKRNLFVDITFADLDDIDSGEFEPGQVAVQREAAGRDLLRRQVLTVAEKRDSGLLGGKRWIRMPDVVGLGVERAEENLRALGLASIDTKERAADESCAAGTVCASSPETDARAFLQATQLLYVGVAQPESQAVNAGAREDISTEPSAPSSPDSGTASSVFEGSQDPATEEDATDTDYEPIFNSE